MPRSNEPTSDHARLASFHRFLATGPGWLRFSAFGDDRSIRLRGIFRIFCPVYVDCGLFAEFRVSRLPGLASFHRFWFGRCSRLASFHQFRLCEMGAAGFVLWIHRGREGRGWVRFAFFFFEVLAIGRPSLNPFLICLRTPNAKEKPHQTGL